MVDRPQWLVVEPRGERYLMLRLGVGWIYSEPGGHLVLRDQTSWRKISGVWINTPYSCLWFMFRRHHSRVSRRR